MLFSFIQLQNDYLIKVKIRLTWANLSWTMSNSQLETYSGGIITKSPLFFLVTQQTIYTNQRSPPIKINPQNQREKNLK